MTAVAQIICWSAVLQFPLVYVPCAMIALCVYGMSFLTAAGYVVLAGAAGLIVLHRLMARQGDRWFCPSWLLLVNALVTALAYRVWHMDFFDERSVHHAVLLIVVGLFSLLTAHRGAAEAGGRKSEVGSQRSEVGARPAFVVALALLAPVWLCAVAYPLMPLLWCAMVMAMMSAVAVQPVVSSPLTDGSSASRLDGVSPSRGLGGRRSAEPCFAPSLLIFLLAMDFSAVIYDYGVVTTWGLHVAVLMLAAGVGSLLCGRLPRGGVVVIAIVAAANYVTAVVYPDWLLNPAHAAITGLALGWVVSRSAFRIPRSAFPIALGMAASYWIAQNLALSWLRLALPAAMLIVWSLRRLARIRNAA